MDWIDVAQDRDQWWALVNTVMNLRVPQNVEKFLSRCIIGGFSRRVRDHEVQHTDRVAVEQNENKIKKPSAYWIKKYKNINARLQPSSQNLLHSLHRRHEVKSLRFRICSVSDKEFQI
jgi:hypothetical protein